MYRRGLSIIFALAVCATIGGTSSLTAAQANQPPMDDEITEVDSKPVNGVLRDQDGNPVTGVPFETITFVETIRSATGLQDRIASITVSDDQTDVDVTWYGTQPPELIKIIDSAPASVRVTLTASPEDPAMLRQIALDIANNPETFGLAGKNIVSTATNNDGTGVKVQVAPGSIDKSQRERASEKISTQSTVPVVVTASPKIVPAANRLDDSLHIGGSRWMNASNGNSCSTAFAVDLPGQGGAGMLTAAHCADINTTALRYGVPTTTNPSGFVNIGSVTSFYSGYDSELITGSFYQRAVYSGSYTSTAYTTLSGAAAPVVGIYLCFSGSYSGLVCGNRVNNLSVNYNFGFGVITASESLNINGEPGAGNGDSGGPGLMPVQVSGFTVLWASTIISAIPAGSPAVCLGVPGSTATNGRKCSPTVFSTDAIAAAAHFGAVISHF